MYQRKRKVEGFSNTVDWVDVRIQGFEGYKKKSKDRLITANNSDIVRIDKTNKKIIKRNLKNENAIKKKKKTNVRILQATN